MTTAVAVRSEQTALAGTDASPRLGLLRPIAAPSEIIQAQNEAREMVHQALLAGRDYGVIPGTGDKPTMLKPGAERVALGFGCYYGTPEILEQEIDHDREVRWSKTKAVWEGPKGNRRKVRDEHVAGTSLGLYRYVVRVPVINRETGQIVGSGVGACSSMESKYIERPRDVENTVLKMAFKRAIVAACLTTFGLSDEFTQDVEDLPRRDPDSVDGGGTGDEPAPSNEPAAVCPKCGKGMWDNRAGKTNPKAPDYKCKDRSCDGVYWPGQWPPAPAATDEQKAKIRELLATADLDDERKTKTLAMVDSTDKPLSAKRACEILEKLEKLAQPVDPTQSEMDLGGEGKQSAGPTTGSVAAPETATSGAPSSAPTPPASTPSLTQLTQRITTLLENPKFSDDERKTFRAKLEKADTVEVMTLLIHELESFIEMPF